MSIMSIMKYVLDKSRLGMLIFLGVAVAALWVNVVYGFYKDSAILSERYDVRVKPGAVSYGTHSTETAPMISAQLPSSAVMPMISGNTVRSIAYSGHAAASNTVSSSALSPIRTTSVAPAGANGGGGGGDASAYTSSRRRTSVNTMGVSLSIAAIPIPKMATVSRSYATEVSSAMGESYTAEETLTGRKADPPLAGAGSPSTPDVPIQPAIPLGNTPRLLMLLLAAGYGFLRRRRSA